MAKRQIIAGADIPTHAQPFPTAVRLGNMIFSSAVGGHDPKTQEVPEGKEAQIAQAFANMRTIVEAGGGTTGDIGKVVVYLRDRKDRDIVNVEWIKMFPEEGDRPVRHTVGADLSGKRVIQLEFIAVV